jgi:hypothetical protein
MTPMGLAVVGLGVLLHLFLGHWVSCPWLVPDVTLVSMVCAMLRTAGSPLMLALLGGCLTTLFTARHPLLVGMAYVGAGWLVAQLARRWDLTEASMQRAAVGLTETLLVAVWLLLDGPVSLRLMLLSGFRVFLTLACLPLARYLVGIAGRAG